MNSRKLQIIHTSDWHLGCNVNGLADDFYVAANRFVEQLANIHRQTPVDLVLIAGDIFHTPDSKSHHLFRIIRIFKKMKEIFTTDANEFPPVLVTRGNHDVSMTTTSKKGTQLMILKEMKLAYYLEDEIFEPEWLDKVRIYGVGYSKQNQAKRISSLVQSIPLDGTYVNVLMVHTGIISKSIIQPKGHRIGNLAQEDIQMIGFDYIALGDFHNTFKDQTINLGNPGSLEATSKNEWDYHGKQSQFFEIKLYKTGSAMAKVTFTEHNIQIRPKQRFKIEVNDTVSSLEDFTQLITADIVPHIKKNSLIDIYLEMSRQAFDALINVQLKEVIDLILDQNDVPPKVLYVDYNIEQGDQGSNNQQQINKEEIISTFIQNKFVLDDHDIPQWFEMITGVVEDLGMSKKPSKTKIQAVFQNINGFLEEIA